MGPAPRLRSSVIISSLVFSPERDTLNASVGCAPIFSAPSLSC